MTSFIKSKITKSLGRFCKDFNSDKISLSFFRGEGELTNLELNEAFLQDFLNLPTCIGLHKIICNKVTAKVSWTKIQSKPIELYIDVIEVEILASEEEALLIKERIEKEIVVEEEGKYGFQEKVVDGLTLIVNRIKISFKILDVSNLPKTVGAIKKRQNQLKAHRAQSMEEGRGSGGGGANEHRARRMEALARDAPELLVTLSGIELRAVNMEGKPDYLAKTRVMLPNKNELVVFKSCVVNRLDVQLIASKTKAKSTSGGLAGSGGREEGAEMANNNNSNCGKDDDLKLSIGPVTLKIATRKNIQNSRTLSVKVDMLVDDMEVAVSQMQLNNTLRFAVSIAQMIENWSLLHAGVDKSPRTASNSRRQSTDSTASSTGGMRRSLDLGRSSSVKSALNPEFVRTNSHASTASAESLFSDDDLITTDVHGLNVSSFQMIASRVTIKMSEYSSTEMFAIVQFEELRTHFFPSRGYNSSNEFSWVQQYHGKKYVGARFLKEMSFEFRCSNFVVLPTVDNEFRHSAYTKTLSSMRGKFQLPPETAIVQIDYIQYFYDTITEGQIALPDSHLRVKVNPIMGVIDRLHLTRMQRFIVAALMGIDNPFTSPGERKSESSDSANGECGDDPEIVVRIECLLPKIVLPPLMHAKDPRVANQVVEVNASKIVMCNTRKSAHNSNHNAVSLATFHRGRLFNLPDSFPNNIKEDLQLMTSLSLLNQQIAEPPLDSRELWNVQFENLWVDFLPEPLGHPVPFMAPSSFSIFLHQVVPCEANAETKTPDMCVYVDIPGDVHVTFNHLQYLYLLRMDEDLSRWEEIPPELLGEPSPFCICLSVDRVYLSLTDSIEAYEQNSDAEKSFIMGLVADHVELISETQPLTKLLKVLIEKIEVVNLYEDMKSRLTGIVRDRRNSYLTKPGGFDFLSKLPQFRLRFGNNMPPVLPSSLLVNPSSIERRVTTPDPLTGELIVSSSTESKPAFVVHVAIDGVDDKVYSGHLGQLADFFKDNAVATDDAILLSVLIELGGCAIEVVDEKVENEPNGVDVKPPVFNVSNLRVIRSNTEIWYIGDVPCHIEDVRNSDVPSVPFTAEMYNPLHISTANRSEVDQLRVKCDLMEQELQRNKDMLIESEKERYKQVMYLEESKAEIQKREDDVLMLTRDNATMKQILGYKNNVNIKHLRRECDFMAAQEESKMMSVTVEKLQEEIKRMQKDFAEERSCFRESKIFMMESFNATQVELSDEIIALKEQLKLLSTQNQK
eukprot:Nk52_evm29s210 gene=Nk52_evmTU29s210